MVCAFEMLYLFHTQKLLGFMVYVLVTQKTGTFYQMQTGACVFFLHGLP
jgi:hypothetical protein